MASGEIDALIFLRDPLTAGPHEPDVTALLRVADVHNVAVATNLAGAECLVRAFSPEGTLSTRTSDAGSYDGPMRVSRQPHSAGDRADGGLAGPGLGPHAELA